MTELLQAAFDCSKDAQMTFAKFLSPNDTGLTGGHQCGIYIPKKCVPLIFDELFDRGENQSRTASITWNNEDTTLSRFIYYGQGTRNEYRITRFGRGFTLIRPEHTGDLVIICKETPEQYSAFVLSDDDDISCFLDAFSLAPTELPMIVQDKNVGTKKIEDEIYDEIVFKFNKEFPSTVQMAESAREISSKLSSADLLSSPDDMIVSWTEAEYKLFRRFEEKCYEWVTLEPAPSLDAFVATGLEITNRRKARAGKSLEHHLAQIFNIFDIRFEAQVHTEGHEKPDFIFPSGNAYHDPAFPEEKLFMLGAKTTCKDRWRQVLNEAERIPHKYLFTLQQGNTPNQLEDMHRANLTLVVPKSYHHTYPKMPFEVVISFEEFIHRVREAQDNLIN